MVVAALKQRPPPRNRVSNTCRPVADSAKNVYPWRNYPRPRNDNGRGIHWAHDKSTPAGGRGSTTSSASYAIMNIKWVKMLQDDHPT